MPGTATEQSRRQDGASKLPCSVPFAQGEFPTPTARAAQPFTARMSAHAAAAMSNAVLAALNRLSDGHTRRTAWNELTAFAERLDAQKLPGFLACLHATNDRYTIACRRGAIQLYGRLGSMHPQLLAPHLPKIADYLVTRLRDKDPDARPQPQP